MPTPTSLEYSPEFEPPVELSCGLMMVPHGQTPSNVQLLFQNHSDGAYEQLLTPKGEAMAASGAAAFVAEFGPLLRSEPGRWVLYRSPLSRTAQTSAHFLAALTAAGVEVAEPDVDADLIEINAGSWSGYTVEGLAAAGRDEDAALAAAYRNGSFTAQPVDGSGESLLQLLARAARWLRQAERRHGQGSQGGAVNVLVFGHGTFQNAVEVLLRSYPEKTPAQVFSRVSGGSHLRRGQAHVLAGPL